MSDLSVIKLPNNQSYNLKDSQAVGSAEFSGHTLTLQKRNQTTSDVDLENFDALNVTDLTSGNLINTGSARFINGLYGNVTGNADTATKLENGHTIRTNLASTSTASFDGSSDITPGVTGTLGVSNGGTGQTSANAAANAFINALGTGTATTITDAVNIITQDTNTSVDTYYRRPVSVLWSYIQGKINSVLGLNASTYSGKAATAGTADSATSATNLGTNTNVGNESVPVYFKNGLPTVIQNNITGSGTSGYLVKFNGENTITNGPKLGSATNTFLRNDGTWASPVGTQYDVVSKDSAGLVPQLPNESTTTKFLRQDGTWAVPPDNNTHNTAYLYAGASNGSANAATSNGSTYLILVDGGSATTRRKISGSGATSVTSNASGDITISSTNTWTKFVGATSSANGTDGYITAPTAGNHNKFLRGDGTWAVPTDNNTWTAFVGATASADGTAGYVPAPGAGNQAKFFRADGTWAVPTDTNTHLTAHLYVGGSSATGNAAVTTNGNVYLILADNDNYDRRKIAGSGATTVKSDANGSITIASTDTWEAMTGATSSANGTVGYVNAVPPKDGYNTKFLRADGTWAVPNDKDTHLTGHFYVGGSSATGNAATTNGNTYLILADNSNYDRRKIAGTAPVSVTSNASGAITVAVSAMGAASSSADGTSGLVPAPGSGKQSSFLRGDGTWATPTNTTYSAGVGLTLSSNKFNLDMSGTADGSGMRYINTNDMTTWTAQALSETDSIAFTRGNVTDAYTTGHMVWLNAHTIGTPFQLVIHDSAHLYFYKRWWNSTDSTWSAWTKMNAGHADTAGSATTANTATSANTLNASHGNELFLGTNNQTYSTLWFNYRSTINGETSGNTAITGYYFGNRNAKTTGVTLYADNFSGNAASATKANITSNKYGIAYYTDAAGTFASTATGSSGQLLQSGGSSATPSWITATDSNTASTVVKRDSSGGFSAGTISASMFQGIGGGHQVIFVDDKIVTTADNKVGTDTKLTTSDSDEEWLKALLVKLCDTYPNVQYIIFEGYIAPNSRGYYKVHIYDTSTRDSTTQLPQHSYGEFRKLSTDHWNFGTRSYSFFCHQIMYNSGTWAINISGNAATATTAASATAANLTSTANAVAYFTNTTGIFGSKASANGALYATATNGELKWGTLPVAQGGTSATTAIDAITNLGGAYIKACGTNIAESSNIDTDYKEAGTYYSSSNTITNTLSGTVPVSGAGLKLITYIGYRPKTIRQFLDSGNNDLFYRSSQDTGATWTKWYKFVLLPSGSDNKTFANVGSATQPVYIDSHGIITACTSYDDATVGFVGKGKHTAAVTANEFTPDLGSLTVVGNVSNTTMTHTNNANAEMIIKTHPTSGSHYYEARLGFSSNGHLYYMPVDTTTWKDVVLGDGTGASGTWGISITGSSAALSGLNSSWEIQSGTTSRPTTANKNFADNKVRYFLATSSMTEGKPSADAHILHLPWDNGAWDVQLAVLNSKHIQIRGEAGTANTWENWITVLDSNNYGDYALPLTGGTLTGTLLTAGTDIILGTSGTSSNDSGDLVWRYGNGNEKMRIWGNNEYTAKQGPYFRIYNSSGTSLYNGTLPLADGSGASGTWGISITGNAKTASMPEGFSTGSTSSAGWGNQAGTGVTTWNETNGGSIEFRRDNPSSGKLSIKVDGRFYGNEGNSPAMLMQQASGYWGLASPDAADDVWIRTTSNGIIPYQSGGSGSGHQSIGTSSWYFQSAYIDNIYGTLNGNATSATSATTATTATHSNYPMFVSNNELRFSINSKPSSAISLCVGYKWSDGTSDAKISRYIFYNGAGAVAGVQASTFYGALSGTGLSNKNLDDYKTTGKTLFYYGAGNNGCTNVPIGDGIQFGMMTYATASGHVAQELSSFNGDSSNGKWIRFWNSSSWSAWQKIITSVGGTMTGIINLPYNKQSISFRYDSSNYDSGFVYSTYGNECLALVQQNAVTSFMVVHGSDPSTWVNSTWNSAAPTIQTKNKSLYVNELIKHNITPVYNFKVNGTSYFGGEVNISDTSSETENVSLQYNATTKSLDFIFE